jgi:hypothetical protein
LFKILAGEVLVSLASIARHATERIKIVSDISTTSTVEPVRCLSYSSHEFIQSWSSYKDLRALGQTTKIERSTLAQVQARIAYLREKTKEAASAKAFDFDQRLAEVREKEQTLREQRKAEKKAAKEKARLALINDSENVDSEMTALMGFGGFGSSKK